MADTKISALTAATAAAAANELVINEAGTSKKLTASLMREYMAGDFARLAADYTLTNSGAEQKLFNASTNGALTLATGTYLFEAVITITTMSATSGNGAFDILGAGTATLADISYVVHGNDAASGAAGAAVGGSHHNAQQTNTNMVTAATGTALGVHIRGSFECTGAGTVIPSITLTTAAAAVVKAGSYILVRRIGATGVATQGDWS